MVDELVGDMDGRWISGRCCALHQPNGHELARSRKRAEKRRLGVRLECFRLIKNIPLEIASLVAEYEPGVCIVVITNGLSGETQVVRVSNWSFQNQLCRVGELFYTIPHLTVNEPGQWYHTLIRHCARGDTVKIIVDSLSCIKHAKVELVKDSWRWMHHNHWSGDIDFDKDAFQIYLPSNIWTSESPTRTDNNTPLAF
jgi:hypothetical protein